MRVTDGASLQANAEGIAFASGARTASQNSADIVNDYGKKLYVYVDVTAQPGGGETLGVALQMRDPVTGDYVNLINAQTLFTAAIGKRVLVCSEGSVDGDYGGAVGALAVLLPRTFRISTVHSGSGSWTYSVGYQLIG